MSKRTHDLGFRYEEEWETLDGAKGMVIQGQDTKSEETWNVIEPNGHIYFCLL